jgi:hypothetical protein
MPATNQQQSQIVDALQKVLSPDQYIVQSPAFSIDFSQSSASIGSLACEKVVGQVLRNSPSLDRGGGGVCC